ncbi:glutathione S-transferase N-terminal domain-containing protein [Ectothiorhodospiraceae bacterium WFHF3C12]|nr:glutathione S-transferase N-terminal domain-containing protein [Ectothiorhodospiraceae bacterium WFHF3C12]
MATVGRRSVMSLFSSPECPFSHRVRFVLAEKGASVELLPVAEGEQVEELYEVNPYGTIPTLVDRDLALYDTKIITEYLDERFPHPPLMPVDPVSRAKARLVVYRIEKDWYSLLESLRHGEGDVDAAREELTESLISSDEVFAAEPFFLSEELTVMDCALAPLLWRLPYHGIDLTGRADAILEYADRLFARDSFQESLTDREKAMRA